MMPPRMHCTITGSRLIAAAWQMAPEAASTGMRSGISAAIWRQEAPWCEVQAPADSVSHRLSILLDSIDSRIWFDRRLHVARKLTSDMSLLVPAGTSTRAVCRSGWRILHVFVPDVFLRRTLEEAGLPSVPELAPLPAAPNHTLARLAHTIARTLRNPDPFAQLALDASGLQIALELLRRYSSARVPETGLALSAAQRRRAIEFLHDHLAIPVRLADVAAATGLSVFHFCRAFTASVGVSPQAYLRLTRIRQAEKLLATPHASIEATASRLGYRDAGAFARAFKRETGLTPRAFRAGHRL